MAIMGMQPSREMYVKYRQMEDYCKRVAPEIFEEAIVGGRKIDILRRTKYNYWAYLAMSKTVKDYIMKDKVSID